MRLRAARLTSVPRHEDGVRMNYPPLRTLHRRAVMISPCDAFSADCSPSWPCYPCFCSPRVFSSGCEVIAYAIDSTSAASPTHLTRWIPPIPTCRSRWPDMISSSPARTPGESKSGASATMRPTCSQRRWRSRLLLRGLAPIYTIGQRQVIRNIDVVDHYTATRFGFGIGWSVHDGLMGVPQTVHAVRVPTWFLTLALALLPLARARKCYRARRRLPGCCQHCGYDLRATPERCPECGTVRGS